MTLSLVAVFLPVLFMGGIVGRLLHEFAVTIGVAILVSGAVSLSLTPLLCSRFLRPGYGGGRAARWTRGSERAFEAGRSAYERTLAATLRHPRVVLAVFAGSIVATVAAYQAIPKGFLPSEDIGFVFGFTEAAEGVSFGEMAAHQKAVAEAIRRDPAVASTFASIGASGPNVSVNTGRVFIGLKPRSERDAQRRRRDRAPATRARHDSRHPGVPAESAADPHRRPAHEEPVPARATGTRHRGALPGRRRPARAPAQAARAARRDERRPAQEPDAPRRDPARPGGRARRVGQPGRGGALQRLRVAAGLHDLRPGRPVRRDRRARAGVARGSAVARAPAHSLVAAATSCRSSRSRGSSGPSGRSR